MFMNNDFMLYPGFKVKALTFSYDDGPKEDRHFIELLNKYGLKGTFNLNSGLMPEKKNENDRVSLEEINSLYEGHEVAVHTVHHPFLEKMPSSVVVTEVLDDRRNLEKHLDYVVRGMAYPFGTYNDKVIEACKNCGIKYSRTTEAHHNFILPESWLKMPSTCHHADGRLFELAEKFANSSPKKESYFTTHGWLFYVWGHTYEFRTDEDWARLEKFFDLVSKRDDVWYATNIEIYDYIEAYRALEYSVDRQMIYNPSGLEIWIMRGGKTYNIPARGQIKF